MGGADGDGWFAVGLEGSTAVDDHHQQEGVEVGEAELAGAVEVEDMGGEVGTADEWCELVEWGVVVEPVVGLDTVVDAGGGLLGM